MQSLQSLKTTIAELEKNFRATCRVLFGQEVGGLEEFRPYLLEMVDQPAIVKSAI